MARLGRKAFAGAASMAGALLFLVSAAAADDFSTCDKESGDVALEACTRAIASGRFSGDKLAILHNDRGVKYRDKNDYDHAIEDLNEAIKLNSKYEQAYENRSGVYRQKGDIDRAIADDSALIEINPNFDNFINRGSLYFHYGKYNLALADQNEAIRLNPKHPFGWLNRCELYVVQNKLSNALADCNKSLELATIPEAQRIRGVLYTKSGRYQPALVDLNSALKELPDFAAALYARGVAKLKSGDARGGKADMAKAESMDAQVGESFKMYGIAL